MSDNSITTGANGGGECGVVKERADTVGVYEGDGVANGVGDGGATGSGVVFSYNPDAGDTRRHWWLSLFSTVHICFVLIPFVIFDAVWFLCMICVPGLPKPQQFTYVACVTIGFALFALLYFVFIGIMQPWCIGNYVRLRYSKFDFPQPLADELSFDVLFYLDEPPKDWWGRLSVLLKIKTRSLFHVDQAA